MLPLHPSALYIPMYSGLPPSHMHASVRARNAARAHATLCIGTGTQCTMGGVAGGHARVEALAHSARFEKKGDARAGTLALSAHVGEKRGKAMPRQRNPGTKCTG